MNIISKSIQENGSGNYTLSYTVDNPTVTGTSISFGINNSLGNSAQNIIVNNLSTTSTVTADLNGLTYRPFNYSFSIIYSGGSGFFASDTYVYPQNPIFNYFTFSGLLSDGYNCFYRFEQNPETMSEYSTNYKSKIFETLVGENIYFRPLLDQDIRIMKWSRAKFQVLSGLERFTYRDTFNNIPIVTFSDGPIGDFNNTLIQVIDVYGQPLAGQNGYYSIELQFKPYFN